MTFLVIAAFVPAVLADSTFDLFQQRPDFEVDDLPWGFPTENDNLDPLIQELVPDYEETFGPFTDRSRVRMLMLQNIYEKSYGPICGKFPRKDNVRIIEGIDSPVMFPWMVYIEVLIDVGFFLSPQVAGCTGSIITKRHILTAAHCFCPSMFDCSLSNKGNLKEKNGGISNVQVKVGSRDRREGEFLHVTRIIIHPMYFHPIGTERKNQPEAHDLAIMTLDGDLTFTDTIAPICLPEPGTKDVGFKIDTAGWGVVRRYDRAQIRDTCTTDQYGAAQFQRCQSSCEATEPPNSDTCKLLIEMHPFQNEKRGSVYQIKETGEMCYPFKGLYGWCKTRESWGFCRRTCTFGKNQAADILQYLQMNSANCSEYFSSDEADYQTEMCAIKHPQKPVIAQYSKTETGFKHVGQSGGGVFPFHGFYDTCQGDSGGPFWRSVDKFNEKRAVLVGTVSRGHFCASQGEPGVIERVKTMVDWILEEIIS